MRAGQITVSTREFAVVDVPTPEAGVGQVRIKVAAAGVCLSDVHFLEGILSPGYLDGDHVTLGHEVAGVVDQVGPGVTSCLCLVVLSSCLSVWQSFQPLMTACGLLANPSTSV